MVEPQKRRDRFDTAGEADRGMGQLSLVEHALCPLDSRTSLRENLRHESEYRYTDADGRAQTARVVVHCPAGLSSGDEFYLWGLLALTFAQPEPQIEFQATPHFCLRKLGLISPDSKGGKSYRLFREALRRLSAVRYQNERFYDPIRREHRAVSFGLFSYSLPLDPDSSRAWRIMWDPLFFEYCQAAASQLSFDLETYRKLDHASRRLFLLLSKVFWRRTTFAVLRRAALVGSRAGVLGQPRDPNAQGQGRTVCRRAADGMNVLATPTDTTGRPVPQTGQGPVRGPIPCVGPISTAGVHDRSPRPSRTRRCTIRLRAIGFDAAAIGRILARFRVEQIQLWADVTLAAMERKGPSFFRRSPQAFFMDNIQHAACGERTPPDWFWELRKEEQRRRADHARRMRSRRRPPRRKPRPQQHNPHVRLWTSIGAPTS